MSQETDIGRGIENGQYWSMAIPFSENGRIISKCVLKPEKPSVLLPACCQRLCPRRCCRLSFATAKV
jgi:hypothetical protein